MLKEQIQVISQSKDGRVLTLKNTTGRETSGRDTGYGPVNGKPEDVVEYILQFSRIESNIKKTIRINSTTEYPKLSDVLLGLPFQVNSGMFVEAPDNEGASMFSDGVINVDSFSVWPGLSGVVITKGNDYIDLSAVVDKPALGNAIQVNGKIYQIDTTRPNIAGNVLYIVGVFEDDDTSFEILHQGNTKALLQSVSDNQHAYIVAKVSAQSSLQQGVFIPGLNKALHYKIAAKGFVSTCKDWHKANDLVVAANRLLNQILVRWH